MTDKTESTPGTTEDAAPAPAPTLRPEDMAYTSRTAMIQEIAKRAQGDLQKEFTEKGVDPNRLINAEGHAINADGELIEDVDAAARRRDNDETPAPVVAAGPKQKFIVDGQEVELTAEEITAAVQKHKSADTRLEEATRIVREANEAAQAIRAAATPALPAESATAGVRDSQRPQITRERAAELTRAIQYGEAEEATDAIMEMTGANREAAAATASATRSTDTASMTTEQIQALVLQTNDEAARFQRATALLDLPPDKGGYSDLWSDPQLRRMFGERDAALLNEQMQQKKTTTYEERFAKVAGELRQWRDDLVKRVAPNAVPNNPKPTLQQRETRKAETVVVRSGNARVPAQTPAGATQPKSREDVLNGIRASRGQDRL